MVVALSGRIHLDEAAETTPDHATIELADGQTSTLDAPEADVTVEDVLVEEVSIDGMCGVY